FDGRIDFANLDLTRCKEYEVNKGKLYGLRVYAKALKRYVSLSVWYPMDGRTDKWQLYFSTDDSMDGREVLDYYRTRFQLEFCFRDGKQHAGITNCQSTDFRKLDFHFNASLAAVNLAKAACKRLGITYSISSCKSFIHNAYMLERFICVFGINPDMQVIDKLFKELILFTARAA
ncbi:MAG: transposase, partial [Parabacteroides sp.]|nr:transposase [Parabacteroides sp.]